MDYKLVCVDYKLTRRISVMWRKPANRPSTTWFDQYVKEWQGGNNVDTQHPGSGQIAVEEERDGLAGLRDLVVVVVVVVVVAHLAHCHEGIKVILIVRRDGGRNASQLAPPSILMIDSF